MTTDTQPPAVSNKARWAGYVLSALPAALLLFSGVMKLVVADEKGFSDLGWPPKLAVCIGVTEIACTILYIIPQTAVLGAILLTGYLGGAVATHVRIEDPMWFGGAVVGVVLWLGLYLREPRLRRLAPWRS